jgi:ATP-dependent DNA helicase RecG
VTASRRIGSGDELGTAELRAATIRSRPRPERLQTPVSTLRGAGPKLAAAAAELGIETIGDLLLHVPRGYRDRTRLGLLGELRIGEEATVLAEVRSVSVRPTRRRNLRIVEAVVADASGQAKAVWFNQPWLAERLRPGTRVLLNGKLERGDFRVAAHEIVGADSGSNQVGIHTTGLVPIHPASERLRPGRLREWAWQAMPNVVDYPEALPAELRARRRLPAAADALLGVHFPRTKAEAAIARDRLAFEELLLHQVALAARRRADRSARPGVRLDPPGELVVAWLRSLPFALTSDQRRALGELDRDLASGEAMQRLLMGEVGSGKAQPLDSSVLTPTGFRPMRSIRPGDQIINPIGKATTVTGVFPQGEREVWRVRFSDASTVECDPEHLWSVRTSQARCVGRGAKVMTLREIASDLRASNGEPKWHVELPVAADFDGGVDRPLDAYLIGLLLGDGGLSLPDRVRFTSADNELVEAVRNTLPPGCELRREVHRPYDWNVIGARPDCEGELERVRAGDHESFVRAYRAGASQRSIATRAGLSATAVRYHLLKRGVVMRKPHRSPSPLLQALRSLDLMGTRAATKAVPVAYLNAPIRERHAVLQGLLDTDGTLSRTGMNVTFSSASRQLAENVAWLVRSLGGRSRCRKRVTDKGAYWLTSVILPESYPPFRLARKANRLRRRTKYAHPAKAIVDVERVGRKPVQCIAVAHPNQLYVTDGFTVTHNTVIAVYAMLRAAESGFQAVLMAPTETLAEQHAATLDRLLAGVPVSFGLLTGATSAARRREALGRLASGELELAVGTHALLEPDVEMVRLAVAVVDEQHRFGVRQRTALAAKGPRLEGEGRAPHALHMTATPIPRTLSLTAYGDLDATVLRELPAGRRPVRTWAVGEEKRGGAYEFIRERLREGRQAYVVCPLVEGSERLEAKAAAEEAERLRRGELRDFEVGLLHGQMAAGAKAAAMEAFAAGRTDVLVATTVIEVGIDVANATVMLIEGAERFGLSQLHQLRGRVGRGAEQSFCILFADAESELAQRRIEALVGERDGFKLAEVELALRGEGELLGTRQHGLPRFRVAELPEDARLLLDARAEVQAMVAADGSLDGPELAALVELAGERFGDDEAFAG